MPGKYRGRNLYPLEVLRVQKAGERLYDRDTRGRSYYYLAVERKDQGFDTVEQQPFYTAKGERLDVPKN